MHGSCTERAAPHRVGLIVVLLASCLVGVTLGASRRPRGERLPWLVLAAGVALWVAGDIAWEILALHGPVPASPNVADPGPEQATLPGAVPFAAQRMGAGPHRADPPPDLR